MGKMFGTDGVRGVANKELTPELAQNIAKASTYVLEKKLGRKPYILIGRDTRISGTMLEAGMVAGYTSVGANVTLLGVIPTPALAYLVRKYNADAAVVISASHNSYEFNGIKIFNSDGVKLSEKMEDEIEEEIMFQCKKAVPEINDKIGIVQNKDEARTEYIDFVASTANIKENTLKVGVDCANGATSFYAPQVLEKLGINATIINSNPNGININDKCGSTHLESLQELVKEKKLDIGLAFDGDGDRFLAVNAEGEVVNGDQVMAICAKYLKERNELENNMLVVTVMSNLGLQIFAKENDIDIVKTKVGDKYVLEEMMKHNYSFGGEQSGHIIFKQYNTTGDGMITALQVLSMMTNTGKSLKELSNIVTIYPQVIVNAKVNNDKKHDYIEDVDITNAIKNLEDELKGEGRVLIRPSGTEPLVRVMIEGKDQEYIGKKANEIAKMIEERYS